MNDEASDGSLFVLLTLPVLPLGRHWIEASSLRPFMSCLRQIHYLLLTLTQSGIIPSPGLFRVKTQPLFQWEFQR